MSPAFRVVEMKQHEGLTLMYVQLPCKAKGQPKNNLCSKAGWSTKLVDVSVIAYQHLP